MTDQILYLTDLAVDGAGVSAAPGALLLRGRSVVAAGSPQEIGRPADFRVVRLAGEAILPALGNVHTHLDLTNVGPRPLKGGFVAWLGGIREARKRATPESVAQALRLGARFSLAGGVALVGDIAAEMGRSAALAILEEEGLAGVSFLEVFGIGRTAESARRGLAEAAAGDMARGRAGRVRMGITPHAPYSTTEEVMTSSLAGDLPLVIHLSESTDELDFCRRGEGLFRDLIHDLGLWSDDVRIPGRHPVDWLCELVERDRDVRGGAARPAPSIAVHVNLLEAGHAARLAGCGVHAAYCPRASRYFGHHEHPWRELARAGVTVALGTDSIVCLDTPDRLSTLDEMRFLARHDAAPLAETLPMATVNVARALGVDPTPYTLAPGEKAGLLAVRCAGGDPARRILEGVGAPRWLLGPG